MEGLLGDPFGDSGLEQLEPPHTCPPPPQGVTFRVEGGELVIARILHGGMVAQQGLLHVGDIIKEVNGQPVGSDPRALQELLRSASGSVILKILPSYQEPHLPRQVGPSTQLHPA